MTEVFHDPLRLRYRLIGTYVTALAGRDATGRWLDHELYGAGTEDLLWAFRACIGERAPVAVREQVQFVAKEWVTIEALMLPLGDTDAEVGMVCSAVDVMAPGVAVPPHGTSFVLDWRLG